MKVAACCSVRRERSVLPFTMRTPFGPGILDLDMHIWDYVETSKHGAPKECAVAASKRDDIED